MSRKCFICGKKSISGNSISRKGKAKKQGGVGKKTTGINKRKFRPNLQPKKIVHSGTIKKVLVCTKCLKKGKVEVALSKPAVS
ncbi:MAG: 50S ribosomal protein L28 [Candidatus Omnitrophica bacterium]|nr:50S ribosomal protein L28 [Candidatus Omnitrophota bacterium]MCF7877164.1 50S ribosomal protein L28 [Candidatus Omnitrophota bacterium]MCF7878411.1 50S ribosomal protein L28 [Candidatus Omnitrophota bacterium]MCF7892864.1 50S ribosomal protein L28 [Candidatus Omnitrophota bacterium]